MPSQTKIYHKVRTGASSEQGKCRSILSFSEGMYPHTNGIGFEAGCARELPVDASLEHKSGQWTQATWNLLKM